MKSRKHRVAVAALWSPILLYLNACHRVQPQVAPESTTTPFVEPTCSVESSNTVAHAGDAIQLHVKTAFANVFPLTYYWTSQAGTLRGKGTDMTWRPKDSAPGTYRVSARVDDGHGREANCSIGIELVASLE